MRNEVAELALYSPRNYVTRHAGVRRIGSKSRSNSLGNGVS